MWYSTFCIFVPKKNGRNVMKISPGLNVSGKVVSDVSPACRCNGTLFRAARFEDGSYGILTIRKGEVSMFNAYDHETSQALKTLTEMPTLTRVCGDEKIIICGIDMYGPFRLDLMRA